MFEYSKIENTNYWNEKAKMGEVEKSRIGKIGTSNWTFEKLKIRKLGKNRKHQKSKSCRIQNSKNRDIEKSETQKIKITKNRIIEKSKNRKIWKWKKFENRKIENLMLKIQKSKCRRINKSKYWKVEKSRTGKIGTSDRKFDKLKTWKHGNSRNRNPEIEI